jgi:type IV pilus assembly protein PilY1
MSNRTAYWRKTVCCVLAYALLFGQIAPAAASTDISDVPLAVKNRVGPNIVLSLDDSGSMQWEFLPEEEMRWSFFLYPRPANPYLGSTYANQAPNFNDTNLHNFFGRSSHNNRQFYNPNITYRPWVHADGSEWPQANPTAAFYNPASPATGTINLTVQRTEASTWFSDNGTGNINIAVCDPAPCGANHAYWPITYFRYNSGNIHLRSSYTRVEIRNTDPASTTYPYTRPDGTAATRTKAEEVQNFANWFVYHRSRISAARGGIGRAFSALSENPRIGFGTINTFGAVIDGASSSGAMRLGVRPFTAANRETFYDALYTLPIPAQGTPLRETVHDIGEYFRRTDDLGPWG